MTTRLKESFAIHADESPVKLLQPRLIAYAWLYLGDVAKPMPTRPADTGVRIPPPARARALNAGTEAK